MDIEALIAKRLAAPKKFRVTAHYADGATKFLDVETAGQAENVATGYRRKLGCDLICRETGKTVRVVDVTVEGI
jgi:hypothetical protein